MKNYKFLILGLMVMHLNIEGQSSSVDSISKILDDIYLDGLYNSQKDYDALSLADSFLLSIYHIKDTLLEKRLNDYIVFRNNITRESFFVPAFGLEEKFYVAAKTFKYFQEYAHLNYSEIPDSLIKDEAFLLLDYHQVSKDTHFLINIIKNANTHGQFMYPYFRLFEKMDSAQFTQFYYDYNNFISRDTYLLGRLINDSKRYHKPYPLLPNAETVYLNYYDTSDQAILRNYNYYFKDGPFPENPSLVEARKQKAIDSENDWRERNELRRIEEELRQSQDDSLGMEALRNSDPIFYAAAEDSTLYGSDNEFYPPIPVGDDGMRFDTITNDSLFYRLEQINLKAVYDTVRTESDLNSNTTVIHLRKLLQIIGDRYLNNTLIPNSSQIAILDQVIDQYTEYIFHDSVNVRYRTYESMMQICRLWRLAEHKYIYWPLINSPNLQSTLYYLFKFQANETMIINFIQKADSLNTIGNLEKANIYIAALSTIYNTKYLEPYSNEIPPRRPIRSLVDSNRWCKEFIIPTLRRYKYID